MLKASLTPGNKERTIYWMERIMEAKYRLALAYFKRGDYNDTIQSLKSLLNNLLNKKRKVAVLSTIADAHLNLGKNMDALQGYEDALEENPDQEVEEKIKKRVEPKVRKEVGKKLKKGAEPLEGTHTIEIRTY